MPADPDVGRAVPDRTAVRRLPENAVRDVAALHRLLDVALVAHVGIVEQGQPFVLPMACARDGDRLLLHGSTGSRLMRSLAEGTPACATVTVLDGLVYARSAFESSMHYRSAVVLGPVSRVVGDDLLPALRVLTEHLLPGRWDELRPPTRKEIAATAVLAMPLREWSVKVSADPPEDPPEDRRQPVWAGVVPLVLAARRPVDAPDLAGPYPPPAHAGAGYPPVCEHADGDSPSGVGRGCGRTHPEGRA